MLLVTQPLTADVLLGSRIKTARQKAGLTQGEVADVLDKDVKSIGNWERDQNLPPVDVVPLLAKTLGVSITWLLLGEGEDVPNMLPDTTEAQPNGESVALPQEYTETFLLTVYTHLRASAGRGLFGWEPGEEDVIRVQRSKRIFAELLGFWPPDDLQGIRVSGWSMKRNGGGIDHGQIVLFRPVQRAADVESGRRYVLTVSEDEENTRVLVKRVQFYTGGGIKLISDNPASGVEDEILVPHDEGMLNQKTMRTARVRIIGAVLWPREDADEATTRAINQTIEALIARGLLPVAA